MTLQGHKQTNKTVHTTLLFPSQIRDFFVFFLVGMDSYTTNTPISIIYTRSSLMSLRPQAVVTAEVHCCGVRTFDIHGRRLGLRLRFRRH